MSIAKTTRPHLLTREAAAARIEALEAALRNTGVCMSCVFGWPEPYGCTDCLNTGWEGGSPAGFVRANRIEALEAALREIARQKTTGELSEQEHEGADFEEAYDTLIRLARATIAPEQDKSSDAIAALAKRFWTVHPKEIQDIGVTREQFYEREMRTLFAIHATRIEALEAALQDANAAYDHGFREGTATRAARIEALEAALRECIQYHVKAAADCRAISAVNQGNDLGDDSLTRAIDHDIAAEDIAEIANAAFAPKKDQT